MIRIILLCFGYAVLNVTGAALIKSEIPYHSLNRFKSYLDFLLTFKVILGFSIIVFSALVIFKALSLGKFSYVMPIATGLNFALTVFVGYWIFKDKLSILSFVGFSFIIFGIVILSLNNR